MADLKTAFHVAKLAMFNIRVLYAVECGRHENPMLDALVVAEAKAFGVTRPVSLMHQGTFLGALYLVVVWLWNQAGLKKDTSFYTKLEKRIDLTKAAKVLTNPKPRSTDAATLLEAIRNATAHGRVEVNDTHLIFTDKNMRKPSDVIVLQMSWQATGELVEAIFWTLNHTTYSTR